VAALFDPALEVGRGNAVGPLEERAAGKDDRSGLVDHSFGSAEGVGIRPVSTEAVALVLHDQIAPTLHIIKQAAAVRGQIGPVGVSADADEDSVVAAQVGGSNLGRAEKVWVDAQLLEGPRHVVARSHHVADAEASWDFHVDSPGAIRGRAV